MPTPIYLTLRKLSQNQDLKPDKYRLSKFYVFLKTFFESDSLASQWCGTCSMIAGEKSSSPPWCCVDGGALSLKWQFHCNVRKCVLVHYPPATTWRCDPCACGLQSLPPPPEQLMKYGWLEFCRCSVKSRIGVILHTRPRPWSSDKVLITLLNTKVWKTRSTIYFYVVMLCL